MGQAQLGADMAALHQQDPAVMDDDAKLALLRSRLHEVFGVSCCFVTCDDVTKTKPDPEGVQVACRNLTLTTTPTPTPTLNWMTLRPCPRTWQVGYNPRHGPARPFRLRLRCLVG